MSLPFFREPLNRGGLDSGFLGADREEALEKIMGETMTVVWVSEWDHAESSVPPGGMAVILGEHPPEKAEMKARVLVPLCSHHYGAGLLLVLDGTGHPVGQRYRTRDLRTNRVDTRPAGTGVAVLFPRLAA